MRHRLHAALLALGLIGLSVGLVYQPKPVALAASYNATASNTLLTYIARGQGAAGLPPDTAYFFDDFEYAVTQAAQKWAASSSGSAGSTFPLAGTKGWWISLSTGATAASAFDLTTQVSAVDNSRTSAWYMAARFKTTAGVDAQAVIGVGLDDGSTQTVIAGFTGPANASNFSIQYAGRFTGSAINLGVAADANAHVFEMWAPGDGTNLCGRIDSGTIICAAPGASVVTGVPRVVTHNGSTAANRNIALDWTLFLTGRS